MGASIILDLLLLRLIPIFAFLLVFYSISHSRDGLFSPCFWKYCGAIMLADTSQTLMCVSLSVLSGNVAVANLVIVNATLFLCLFGGALINLRSLPQWAHPIQF